MRYNGNQLILKSLFPVAGWQANPIHVIVKIRTGIKQRETKRPTATATDNACVDDARIRRTILGGSGAAPVLYWVLLDDEVCLERYYGMPPRNRR
jgi:hypothetical protein